MAIPPNCSIDFTRPYSLPVGVPPDSVTGAALATYCTELGLNLEFLELAWVAADPFISHEHPRDPFTGKLRVRFLRNAGGVGAAIVPTVLNPAGVVAADIATVSFAPLAPPSPDPLAPVGKRTFAAAAPASGETMSQAMARTFRWDRNAEEKLWAMPQPYFADESLCLYWPPPAAGAPAAIGTDIPGILANDTSSHLLATTAAARDGELQPDLLRSPVRGLMRFTRYRHLEVTEAGGVLSAAAVRMGSASGAAVVRALPPSTAVPSDPAAPLLRDTFMVFEHVDIEAAADCLASLLWLQFVRFSELEGIPQLRKEVRSSAALTIAVYLALGVVKAPTTNAFSGLSNTTLDKLREVRSSPDLTALRAAITHVRAEASRSAAFAEFLRTTMAPLLCGVAWNELKDGGGSPLYAGIPAAPAARSNSDRKAHAVLEAAQQARDSWVGVYAGAPIGRPATRYRTPATGAPVSDAVRNGFTTFDLETLVLTGRAASAFPNVTAPAAPTSPDQSLSLGAYSGEASGKFAALRIADAEPGSIAYTTRDWLSQTIFGWRRTRAADAPLDFSAMAVAGHPLTLALSWDRRVKAKGLRTSLDLAASARDGSGTSLDRASVAWWATAAAFSSAPAAGHTPVAIPGVGTGWVPTGPVQPSRTAETVAVATAHIAFSAQPSAGSRIVLNGTAWEFVTGTPTGNQTKIGADLDATLTTLAADLNASADPEVRKCRYTARTTSDRIDITGPDSSPFALSALAGSNGNVSAPLLMALSSGFDEDDLDLALEARNHLRSGHNTDPSTAVPPDTALVLALLDREGYRIRAAYMRQGPFDALFRDNLNRVGTAAFSAPSLSKRGATNGIGRLFYTLQVFGLDLIDRPHIPAAGSTAVSNWLEFTWANVFNVITDAIMEGTATNLNTMGLDGRMLLRITSRFDPVTAVGQSRPLSRKLHLAGIIAQHAEFQRRHALLRKGSTAGPLNEWWKPSSSGTVLTDVPAFRTSPAPTPGATSEELARSEYLAYYALCYLAFNASPAVWNSWVAAVPSGPAVGVPRLLLFHITDAASAGGGRELWHRGHFVRFAIALDAYLRMSETGAADTTFPVRTGWPV